MLSPQLSYDYSFLLRNIQRDGTHVLYWLGCLQANYHDLRDELRFQLIIAVLAKRKSEVHVEPSANVSVREARCEISHQQGVTTDERQEGMGTVVLKVEARMENR
jgi:hypothetical protein